jgi:signal transduction histidine kinase
VQPLADIKDITITTKLHKDNITTIGDQKSVEECLVILLDNAVKYSNNSSPVMVTCTLRQKQVVISVSDKGYGISKEDRNHIFDRFYRADPSRTSQETSGHGLGLAIAQDIITKHNGTIDVVSTVGKGSTFAITLPIA